MYFSIPLSHSWYIIIIFTKQNIMQVQCLSIHSSSQLWIDCICWFLSLLFSRLRFLLWWGIISTVYGVLTTRLHSGQTDRVQASSFPVIEAVIKLLSIRGSIWKVIPVTFLLYSMSIWKSNNITFIPMHNHTLTIKLRGPEAVCKNVSMITKCHTHTLQTNLWHHKE